MIMMTRRYLFTLLMLAVGALGASAQLHYVSKVSIGAKAGVTLSRMEFTPGVKQKLVMGKTAGITFKYWEERNFGFIAEINYEQRGWKENFEEAPFSFERRLDYIQVPILTSIFFGGRHVKGFFNAGPAAGYLLGSKAHANFDVNDVANIPDFPPNRMTDQLRLEPSKRFDYGICAGAGIEFIIGRRDIINLEGRYYFGIGNVFPDNRADAFQASRSSSILITVGYSHRIK